MGRIFDLSPYPRSLTVSHRRLCPRQVLGVRMGLQAANLLGLDLPAKAKDVLAIVETDGCFADGVSVATGCWLGSRTLRLVDHGKVAVTVVDLPTERTLRLCPDPLARVRAAAYAPAAPSRWHAQLVGYQRMPINELVQAEPVRLTTPIAALLGRPGERVACAACNEEVLNLRQVTRGARTLCRGCAGGESYYIARAALEQPCAVRAA